MHGTALEDDADATEHPPASDHPAFGAGLRDWLAAGGLPPHETSDAASPEETGAAPSMPDEPITPELVLVDPDLGDRARRLLPDYDTWEARASLLGSGVPGRREQPRVEDAQDPAAGVAPVAEPVDALPAEPVLAPESPPLPVGDEPTPSRRRARRTRIFYGASLAVLAGLVAVLGWIVVRAPGAERDVRPETRASFPSAPSTVESTPGPATSPPPTDRPKRASEPPVPSGHPPRAFGWVPVKNASVYLVEVFRGTRKIFEARTARARVTVPVHWTYGGRRFTLAPGRYRWTVRPGFGVPRRARFDKPIVQARLVVASDGA